jgi:hypothetical protein
MKPQYIVIISSAYEEFFEKKIVFGPFNSVEDIREWLKDKYNNSKYTIDIHPLVYPYEIKL